MFNSSRNVLKARCDNMGVVLKLIFWGYALYLAVMLGLGVWMLFQAQDCFRINVLDTGNGLVGYGYYNNKVEIEVDFARNVLNENCLNNPKSAYMIGYFGGCIENVLVLLILRNVVNIFRKIEKNDSPFLSRSSKSIFHIGVLIIVSGFVRSGFTVLLLGIMKYGSGGNGNAASWWQSLIIGGIVICLSYIFEYGSALQIESDETL